MSKHLRKQEKMSKLNYDDLKVGDKFYALRDNNTAFSRKKIHAVIDGVDWFRYDNPPITYHIVEYEVLGIVRKCLEGEWHQNEMDELCPLLHLRATSGIETPHTFVDDCCYFEHRDYFVDFNEVVLYKELKEKEAREMDIPK